MATWPADGDTNWNTKMLAYLAVEHDTDGTHNQEDWTPSSYAGEESVTLPNGLIIKFGNINADAVEKTVTFGTAFPTGIIFGGVTIVDSPVSVTNFPPIIKSRSTTTLIIAHSEIASIDSYDWIAIGY